MTKSFSVSCCCSMRTLSSISSFSAAHSLQAPSSSPLASPYLAHSLRSFFVTCSASSCQSHPRYQHKQLDVCHCESRYVAGQSWPLRTSMSKMFGYRLPICSGCHQAHLQHGHIPWSHGSLTFLHTVLYCLLISQNPSRKHGICFELSAYFSCTPFVFGMISTC